jgi:UDP-N-acetylmuramoyl-L-alanyl-D-glutamate--2,6-diaminopimelate ligase
MEMSSHALEQERVWGLPVDVATYTNLSQDHLDFHGTMSAYFAAKARLFAGVGAPPPRVAVINLDDDLGDEMAHEFCGENLMTYGITDAAEYRAERIEFAPGETRFDLVTPDGTAPIRSPLSGHVNVLNLLAAACAARARGLSLEQIASAAATIHAAPGRFELVPGSRQAGLTVIVDYAHTDDALRNLIALARAQSSGRVVTLFGCGGDRDRTKRPKMGRVAGEGSDLVIVTSDNPRSEDPRAILDEILTGVRETSAEVFVEPDRRAAIRLAIESARPGDMVLLAGKGHEKTQTFADGAIPFDDVEEASQALRARTGAGA